MPKGFYQIRKLVDKCAPTLSDSQRKNLAEWVFGTIQAGSATLNAVVKVWMSYGGHYDTLRQRLRQTLDDGAHKRRRCCAEIDECDCFVPILTHMLARWKQANLPLAMDVTALRHDVVALTISVLYRDTALPVAWHVAVGQAKGSWIKPFCRLMDTIAPAIPADMRVLMMTDGGLWSPTLFWAIIKHGWHPLMRIRPDADFRPKGQSLRKAQCVVPEPGTEWTGVGTAYRKADRRIDCTLHAYWGKGQAAPWLLLSDLNPDVVRPISYSMRYWIECGFRVFKSEGWQFQRTRRKNTRRVARHWLILTLASLAVAMCGTYEVTHHQDHLPPAWRLGKKDKHGRCRHLLAISSWGLHALRRYLQDGITRWNRGLQPEPWPEPPGDVKHIIFNPT